MRAKFFFPIFPTCAFSFTSALLRRLSSFSLDSAAQRAAVRSAQSLHHLSPTFRVRPNVSEPYHSDYRAFDYSCSITCCISTKMSVSPYLSQCTSAVEFFRFAVNETFVVQRGVIRVIHSSCSRSVVVGNMTSHSHCSCSYSLLFASVLIPDRVERDRSSLLFKAFAHRCF